MWSCRITWFKTAFGLSLDLDPLWCKETSRTHQQVEKVHGWPTFLHSPPVISSPHFSPIFCSSVEIFYWARWNDGARKVLQNAFTIRLGREIAGKKLVIWYMVCWSCSGLKVTCTWPTKTIIRHFGPVTQSHCGCALSWNKVARWGLGGEERYSTEALPQT